ncbi:MAG: hypothetical protein RLY93_04170 [Sumerlaeia bacterium]
MECSFSKLGAMGLLSRTDPIFKNSRWFVAQHFFPQDGSLDVETIEGWLKAHEVQALFSMKFKRRPSKMPVTSDFSSKLTFSPDTVRFIFPFVKEDSHHCPPGWQSKRKGRQREYRHQASSGLRIYCIYQPKTGTFYSYCEAELPRVLFGHNGQMITSQEELDDAFHCVESILQEAGFAPRDWSLQNREITRLDIFTQVQTSDSEITECYGYMRRNRKRKANCHVGNLKANTSGDKPEWKNIPTLTMPGSDYSIVFYSKRQQLEARGFEFCSVDSELRGDVTRVEIRLNSKGLNKIAKAGRFSFKQLDDLQVIGTEKLEQDLGLVPEAEMSPKLLEFLETFSGVTESQQIVDAFRDKYSGKSVNYFNKLWKQMTSWLIRTRCGDVLQKSLMIDASEGMVRKGKRNFRKATAEVAKWISKPWEVAAKKARVAFRVLDAREGEETPLFTETGEQREFSDYLASVGKSRHYGGSPSTSSAPAKSLGQDHDLPSTCADMIALFSLLRTPSAQSAGLGNYNRFEKLGRGEESHDRMWHFRRQRAHSRHSDPSEWPISMQGYYQDFLRPHYARTEKARSGLCRRILPGENSAPGNRRRRKRTI